MKGPMTPGRALYERWCGSSESGAALYYDSMNRAGKRRWERLATEVAVREDTERPEAAKADPGDEDGPMDERCLCRHPPEGVIGWDRGMVNRDCPLHGHEALPERRDPQMEKLVEGVAAAREEPRDSRDGECRVCHGADPDCGVCTAEQMEEGRRAQLAEDAREDTERPAEEDERAEVELRNFAEAVHRLNVDWEGAAHACGDATCKGDCRYVREVQETLDRVLGTERVRDIKQEPER